MGDHHAPVHSNEFGRIDRALPGPAPGGTAPGRGGPTAERREAKQGHCRRTEENVEGKVQSLGR